MARLKAQQSEGVESETAEIKRDERADDRGRNRHKDV